MQDVNWRSRTLTRLVGYDRGADRASNDADVSSIPPLIPYGGFSPVRLEGWPVRRGLPGRQRLKPAPGMRLLTPGLPSPFVHLRVGAVAPYCAGPPTGRCTALEGGSPSAPGALARVRVMLSRSVLAEPAPSAPLAGPSRLHRRAAYTRCLRCAGAPRRPASGSGLSLPFRPDMPSSLTPGSSDIACVQCRDADAAFAEI